MTVAPDIGEERIRLKCPELELLVKIPQAHIEGGRHSMAKCVGEGDFSCKEPVRYRKIFNFEMCGEDYLDTHYFCEAHKPSE